MLQPLSLSLSLVAFDLSAVPPAADATPRGTYVEARSASVFAGGCHYGGESVTSGGEALLVWRFESGSHAGIDLAGLDVALALVGERNLVEGGPRRSQLYFAPASLPEQRAAATALLQRELGATLGTQLAPRVVDLELSFAGDTWSARAPELFAFSGELLPDRACCKMPLAVWYTPFARLEQPIVGRTDEFRFTDERLATSWSRPGENAAFLGRFAYATR